MSNEANLSEKEKWLNLSQSLEKENAELKEQLAEAQTEIIKAPADVLLYDKKREQAEKALAEAKNQLECIDAHIGALVDPTILEEIGADQMGDRDLHLRVMRIFTFLESTIENNLEKDIEIARLNKILTDWNPLARHDEISEKDKRIAELESWLKPFHGDADDVKGYEVYELNPKTESGLPMIPAEEKK